MIQRHPPPPYRRRQHRRYCFGDQSILIEVVSFVLARGGQCQRVRLSLLLGTLVAERFAFRQHPRPQIRIAPLSSR